jgi:hypothetical protein
LSVTLGLGNRRFIELEAKLGLFVFMIGVLYLAKRALSRQLRIRLLDMEEAYADGNQRIVF